MCEMPRRETNLEEEFKAAAIAVVLHNA